MIAAWVKEHPNNYAALGRLARQQLLRLPERSVRDICLHSVARAILESRDVDRQDAGLARFGADALYERLALHSAAGSRAGRRSSSTIPSNRDVYQHNWSLEAATGIEPVYAALQAAT